MKQLIFITFSEREIFERGFAISFAGDLKRKPKPWIILFDFDKIFARGELEEELPREQTFLELRDMLICFKELLNPFEHHFFVCYYDFSLPLFKFLLPILKFNIPNRHLKDIYWSNALSNFGVLVQLYQTSKGKFLFNHSHRSLLIGKPLSWEVCQSQFFMGFSNTN